MAKKDKNKEATEVFGAGELEIPSGKTYFRGGISPADRVRQIVNLLKLDPHTLSLALELEELLPEFLGLASDLGTRIKTLQIDLEKFKSQNIDYERQVK